MLLPNRHGSVDSDSYRYGFNGKERDDELQGTGNSYDYGARMYNPRLMRWFAPDPYEIYYANQSPYSFALNDPINVKDADGNIATDPNGNPIYTSDGYSSQLIGDKQLLVEERTYFSNSGKKISAYFVIATYDENKGTDITKYTSTDIDNLDEKYKSYCYNDALYMTQIKNGGEPDDPIPANFKLVIPGALNDNYETLESILKDEYAFRTHDPKKAKKGDLAAFRTNSPSLDLDEVSPLKYSLGEMNGSNHYSTYKGNGMFRSKDGTLSILQNATYDFQMEANPAYKVLLEAIGTYGMNNLENKSNLSDFYYFLDYKTTVSGITNSKGEVNNGETSDQVSDRINKKYNEDKKNREKTQKKAKKQNG